MELGVAVIIITLLLVFLRVPVAIAFIAPSILYIFYTGVPMTLISQRMVRSLDTYTILAIPLFIYVGSVLNYSGVTEQIFEFANHVVGHVTGGLAQVNIFASVVFSGMSGSALADVGGLGRMLIHAMSENGYERDYSAALTSASATIGPIFPPSVPIIIYGLVAEVSIIGLFLAGIIPALICAISLSIMTVYLAIKHDFPTQPKDESRRSTLRVFIIAFPALSTPVVLIAGMLTGVFGPTELAAFTVAYIVFINIIIYKDTSIKYLFVASKEAAYTTSSILFILAGAALFSWVISVERIPAAIATALFSITDHQLTLLLLICGILLIIGLFLEPIAAILITTPLFLPPMVALGVDPIHFGIILVFTLMIGLVTPPLGLSVFISSDVAGVPVEAVIKSIVPYYIPLLVTLLLLVLFPQLSLFIPGRF